VQQARSEHFFESFNHRVSDKQRIGGSRKLPERDRDVPETLTVVRTDHDVGFVKWKTPQQDRTVLQHDAITLELS
jgi:hypothetical protein